MTNKRYFVVRYPCGEEKTIIEDESWTSGYEAFCYVECAFSECDCCSYRESHMHGYFCMSYVCKYERCEAPVPEWQRPCFEDELKDEGTVIWVDFKKRRWARL